MATKLKLADLAKEPEEVEEIEEVEEEPEIEVPNFQNRDFIEALIDQKIKAALASKKG